MKRLIVPILMLLVVFSNELVAQDGNDPLQYSNLAQQFIQSNVNGDANTSIIPSVAIDNGFGSFLENPASMGLIKTSYFNLGYFSNTSNQENIYLQNSSDSENTKGRFGNAGIIYSAPTEQGTFVIGGGYNLNTNVNRTNLLSAQNGESTITDAFANPSSAYNGLAFDTYAIDYFYQTGDRTESIFRIGFEPGTFWGINQNAEISQRSSIGEFSLFTATEFKKNLFVGLSVGLVSGSHNYSRNFLEQDTQDIYNGDFIFADENGEGGTDIDDILLEDEINSQILGSNIRIGAIYKVFSSLNIGASVKLPTRLFVTEEYYSAINTDFDDGTYAFEEFDGSFSYAIKKPWEFNVGAAIDDLVGFTISASAELIDYTQTSIELTRDEDLSFEQQADLRIEETIIDSAISANYNFVANLRGGIEYLTNNGVEIRTGFGYYPGKSVNFAADRYVVSAGLGIPLSRDVFLDFTTQYSQWKDRSVIYRYNDIVTGDSVTEFVEENISQINVLVGLKFRF